MKRSACQLSTVCISLYLTKLINRFHVLISVKLIFMYQIRTQPVRLNKTDLVLFEHLSGLKVLLKYIHIPVKKFFPYPPAKGVPPQPEGLRTPIFQKTVKSTWLLNFLVLSDPLNRDLFISTQFQMQFPRLESRLVTNFFSESDSVCLKVLETLVTRLIWLFFKKQGSWGGTPFWTSHGSHELYRSYFVDFTLDYKSHNNKLKRIKQIQFQPSIHQ